ncbi:hypothetical protein C0Z18_25125 [Trinickia dabaoshanensis]|uniref:Uncharacterized protein n=1 Tax=Trinickia dabaoshanensis TaxID=564714 RepID=A0A2N7VFT2_9BURK|nr:hypothetical protein [Trinickia dabaoshanensis]PMS16007.1 hypothetical protein C0Z18_25125 [Trinickia dabaoshanensis]
MSTGGGVRERQVLYAGARYTERIMSHKNEAKFSEQTGGKSTLQFHKRSGKLVRFFGMKKKTWRFLANMRRFFFCVRLRFRFRRCFRANVRTRRAMPLGTKRPATNQLAYDDCTA